METVTLSSKGQLVIPRGVRQAARLVAGARFSVRLVDGEIRLKPLLEAAATTLDDVAGCLAKPGRPKLSDEQARAAIRARLKATNTPR
jgi:AbrB family looped-hinge helix DNA binding protein